MRLGISLVLLLLVLSGALRLSAEEMAVPLATFKGKIIRVQEDQVVLRSSHSYVSVTTDEGTLIAGDLARGAQATVVYRVGDNYALKIFIKE